MILVTGATGNVGSELVRQLLAAEQSVRVLTRDASRVAHLGNQVECAVGDLDKPETLDAAMQGVDRLFLVTAAIGPRQAVNAVGAAKRAGVRHVVKLSSLGAGNSNLKIAQWHRDREKLIEDSGLAWTFLRPGMFMSNTLQWAESIKRQSAVYYPGGAGQTAPIDPYDIAAVAAMALTRPGHEGQAYALTGSELLTIGDQVQIIARTLGRPIQYVDVPPSAAAEGMLQSGMNRELVDALVEMFTAVREGGGAFRTDTVQQVTGRPPRSFELWCREHIAAFQ